MLLQSHTSVVHLLPALPDAWPAGEVLGLCARGGFELDLKWAGGKLSSAVLRSKIGGTCALRYRHFNRTVETKVGKQYRFDGGLEPA